MRVSPKNMLLSKHQTVFFSDYRLLDASSKNVSSNFTFDMVLLGLIVIFSPASDTLNQYMLFGRTILFYLFVILGVYAISFKYHIFMRYITNTSLVLMLLLFVYSMANEFYHPYSYYLRVFNLFFTVFGAASIASVAHSYRALKYFMFFFIIRSIIYGSNYSFTSIGLFGKSNVDYVRTSVDSLMFVRLNWNYNGVLHALSVSMILIMLIFGKKYYPKWFLYVALFISSISLILTVSRTAYIIMLLGGSLIIYFSFKFGFGSSFKIFVYASIAIIGISYYAADIVTSRWTFSIIDKELEQDSRERVYAAALEQFSEYALLGVGEGNFHAAWFVGTKYDKTGKGEKGSVAHNSFIQVWINWGLLAFLLYGGSWIALGLQLLRTSNYKIFNLAAKLLLLQYGTYLLATSGYASKDVTIVIGFILAVIELDKNKVAPYRISSPRARQQIKPGLR